MIVKLIFRNVLALCLLSVSVNVIAADNNAEQLYGEDKLNIVVSSKHASFTLRLKSNPTTGYSWFLREYDSVLVAPVKHQYVAPEKKMIGAPGYELWTFKVKAAGFVVPQQTTLRFVYARPWQGNDGSTQLVFRVSTQK